MIFETLYESSQRGELLLISGGYCRWHLRRDGTITIYEIISQQSGAGQEMLRRLIEHKPGSIVARCPADLAANDWYQRRGFVLEATERTRSGRSLNVWRLHLQS